MKPLRPQLRRVIDGPRVRPFALAGPILVLLIALPLLRPLRHPDDVSTDEMLRLATIRSLVDQQSLSLDRSYAHMQGVVQTPTGLYSAQPPMMALLLSVPTWAMTRLGYTFDENHVLIEYLLTMLGVTLPVAGATGLLYRMGRLFELRRPLRAALGVAVVAASGMLSYAVVLNPHAPAAALVIAGAACLIQITRIHRDDRRAGWFALTGACMALATTIDPAAGVLLALFSLVIPTMRFSPGRRAAGVALYILGAIPVIAVHAAWNNPVTGDLIPASLHTAWRNRVPGAPPVVVPTVDVFDEDVPAARTSWDVLGGHLLWLTRATFGDHGLLSHFPVLILGALGIGAVMHRHWPGSTKMLAGATGAAAIAILVLYRMSRIEWAQAMFAARWFVVFTPMLLFWAGAWLRRRHSSIGWTLAGILLAFSLFAGLVGATGPAPRRGFDRYTLAAAVQQLTHPVRAIQPLPLAEKRP